ncbi:MAG: hypothetical protein HXX16_16620 [Bacteroidales bacterium]|nr:hypothetical protein [Bacteroidales bacterium]
MEIIKDNIDIISIVFSTLSMIIVLSFLIRSMRKPRYDSISKRALLDDLRKSYENEVYNYNGRMVSTKERWQDINHLLLRDEIIKSNEDYLKINNLRLNKFLISNGINEADLIIDKRLIFVLTPFNPRFEKDFFIIKKTCDEVGLRCVRGDEEFFSSDIFSQILRIIVQSRLVIANINGRNPNVLYELGIAQALDKPTILITKTPNDLPIDLKSKRFLVYNDNQDLVVMLKRELIRVLSE